MVFYSILFLLLSNAVTTRRDKSILYSKKTIIILMYATLILFNNFDIVYQGKSIVLYGGLFYINWVTQTYIMFIYLTSCVIIQLTGFYPRKVWHNDITSITNIISTKFNYYHTAIINKMGESYKIIEYPLILLFIISGGVLLISCSDIVSIFLSIELQSYGLYLLCTLYRNSELSTSAGLTYFLLGGLSSTFILLGTSLLYVNYGTTNIDGYYIIGNIAGNTGEEIMKPVLFNTSLLIMSVGFLFKISAAPFHYWSPDVYDAIPTIVTTFVAIVAKISILIFMFGIVQYTTNLYTSTNFNWKYGLLISSLLSLIFGTVLGLVQFRIKRLLAYSTVSHIGFILLGLSINNLDSIEAFMFYLIQYTISNLNMFLIVIAIGYTMYTYSYTGSSEEIIKSLRDRNYSPIQLIWQIKGYYNNNPTLSLSLGITLFSLVGIPPLIGFFAKQMVLSAAMNNGYIFIPLVGILTSVISAVYYLNIVRQIFFEETDHKVSKEYEDIQYKGVLRSRINTSKYSVLDFKHTNITLTSYLSITISVLTLIMLSFMFEPSNLLNIVQILGLLTINI